MQPPSVQPATTLAFCALVACVAAAWPLLALRALGRRAAVTTGILVAAWLCACWWLGVQRAMLPVDGQLPPPFAKVLLPTALAVLGVGLSPLGRRWAVRLPVAWLLLLQSFRLPLELLMAELARQGALPPQMTMHGWNFDVVSGVLGLLLGLWALRRPVPWAVLIGFNVLGLALLLTIVSIAIRSAPGPLAAWPELPRNTLVFFEPFTALPLVLVMSALLGHLLLTRHLMAGVRDNQPSGPDAGASGHST